MSMEIDILGIGIAAPGLADAAALRRILAGQAPGEAHEMPKSMLLSARERRRAPATVRLSFAAAEQACAAADLDPAGLDAVFSSGMGDLEITDYMCRTLAEAPDMLSPTRFHNSVHNAASGYWSIGAGVRGDVTAVSGHRDSAVAGLMETFARVVSMRRPVLLVVYDDIARGPMRDLWPSEHAFGGALIAAPVDSGSARARLRIALHDGDDQWPELPATLLQRIADNPAARLLPLLAAIVGPRPGDVALAAGQGPGLAISHRPA